MATPIICPKEPLSRDLDVVISLSRAQTEIATDLTLLCFCSPSLEFDPDNDRVQVFSTAKAALAAVPANSPATFAINAFFARDDRPQRMAIARVFESATSAKLVGGALSESIVETLKAVSNGSFDITVSDNEINVTGLDFSGISALSDIPAILQAKIAGTTVTLNDSNCLVITVTATGEESTITFAENGSEGTAVAGTLKLDENSATKRYDGYKPGDLVSELQLIQKAASCAGTPIYGWTIDGKYRETDDQKAVAQWAEAQKYAIFGAVSNSPSAYTISNTNSIVFYAMDNNLRNTFTFFHNNAQVYPEVSYLAKLLSVNYALDDSALTMKFKELPGIATVPLTETQLANLEARRCNTYVSIGNTAKTVRPGVQGDSSWFSDSVANLDNYVEELQVAVFNVFLRKPKVPYTEAGQDMLISAIAQINQRYTDNGVFAPRTVETTDNQTGYITLPATQIEATPIYKATASERAARLAPPIAITAYEAGAMHKVNVNVTVEN